MSENLVENYRAVREKIDETCKACGRDPKEVTLIAVSKRFWRKQTSGA